MPTRTKVISPDKSTFDAVSKLLSRLGVSVMASSNTTHTHLTTSRITDKTRGMIMDLGAEIEVL